MICLSAPFWKNAGIVTFYCFMRDILMAQNGKNANLLKCDFNGRFLKDFMDVRFVFYF